MKQISEDKLLRYASGKASLDEIAEVTLALREDPSLKDLISILEKMDANGSLADEDVEIPMCACAGDTVDNLCDVISEKYILRDYFDSKSIKTDHFDENSWLKESGTPLHNIGRILEANGMSVTRHYDTTVDQLKKCLDSKCKAIAVVDSGRLWDNASNNLLHSVVCLSIVDDEIRLYDPAFDNVHSYDIQQFERAWMHSHHYVVCASPKGLEYNPHPIDISDVGLNEELLSLTEAIAENAHEVWAIGRKKEGWTFGPERDDKNLKHPDLVPYSELPESERDYDREVAMQTLRLVRKLGFSIQRSYTLYCPECGEFVGEEMKFCPNCGKKLNWDNLN